MASPTLDHDLGLLQCIEDLAVEQFIDGYTISGARETLHCALAGGYVQRAIDAFREAFGPQMLLYRFETFRDDPVLVLQAIEQFVGMEPCFNETTYNAARVNSVTQYNWRWLHWVLSREASFRRSIRCFHAR